MTTASGTLYLVIRLGTDRYAIDADCVVEVLPLVRLKSIPAAPNGVVGMMSFRGSAIPVMDLNVIAFGAPTPVRLMSRIVIVRYREHDIGGDSALFGLLIPEVLQTAHFDASAFERVGLANARAPYLGPVLTTPDGMLQQLLIAPLLSEELRVAVTSRGVAA
jgi:chemotaxis-related protein WspB